MGKMQLSLSCKSYSQGFIGGNRLVQLIINEEWKKALENAQSDTALTRRWSICQSMTGGRMYVSKILPIHQACTKPNVQVSFIDSLIFAYPKSLQKCETGAYLNPHNSMRED